MFSARPRQEQPGAARQYKHEFHIRTTPVVTKTSSAFASIYLLASDL